MKFVVKLLLLALLVLSSCKSGPASDKEPMMKSESEPVETGEPVSEQIEETAIETEKFFFTKNEIEIPDTKYVYTASDNELILFRPTEFDFGIMVEDQQSDELVAMDSNFEELTNTITNTFANNPNFNVSICEMPMVRIPQSQDTLYIDTKEHMYGIIGIKAGNVPVFIKADADEIIPQIQQIYQENE